MSDAAEYGNVYGVYIGVWDAEDDSGDVRLLELKGRPVRSYGDIWLYKIRTAGTFVQRRLTIYDKDAR